jgi:uncharacterized membrane protein YgdD (TMEM256/DUF423 family)
MDRALLVIGALSGFVGVALGAFGSHALRSRLTPEALGRFETGVRFQLWHTVALFLAVFAGGVRSPRAASATFLVDTAATTMPAVLAAWLFIAGIVLFSGSLYALALTGVRRWGAVTPFGGACFLLGWLALAWAALTA